MKMLLLLDVETTGLDETVHHVIEVGWALWAVPERAMISCGSFLVDQGLTENAAENINGIPAPLLMSGESWIDVQYRVADLQMRADATLAHNAAFDRKWFDEEIQSAPWICTRSDVAWPRPIPGKTSLVDTALAHGVGVVHAHRAISDVLTLVRLLERVAESHDIAEMLQRAMRPKAVFQALVSYDDREKAKAAGFSWEKPTQRWLRRMPVEDAASLPFEVKEVA